MDEVCQRCGGAVSSEGACVVCGFQREDTEFVWNPTFAEGGQLCGQAVGETGNNLGKNGQSNARYKGLSKASEATSDAPATSVLRRISAQLRCSKEVEGDAESYMTAARPILSGPGRMSLGILAAACLYLAIRQHKVAVSLDELSKKASSDRFAIGAALQKLLGALNTNQSATALFTAPPTEYVCFIRRHASILEPLTRSRKQAAVETTFVELMHWVQYSDRVLHAACTPVMAAAVFTIALQAHQVKVKNAVVLRVFELSSKSSVGRRVADIKAMLTDTARLLPWLSKVDAKHIVQHVSTIVKVPMQTKQYSPSPSPPPVASQNSRQSTQISKPSRKRRLAARYAEAETAADGSSDTSSSSHLPKRSKTATEAVNDQSSDDESFDDAIAHDELAQYMEDRTDEAARLIVWQAQQGEL